MSPHPPDSRGVSGEIPSFEGLRGVAALLVFVYHARWKAGNPPLVLAGHYDGLFRRLADKSVAAGEGRLRWWARLSAFAAANPGVLRAQRLWGRILR